jgi:hypothetical protein
MRYPFVIAVTLIAESCGPTAAVGPDSHNPAHCIAAFNNAAYWFKIGQRPQKVTAMLARGAFEMEKVKAAGGSASAAIAEAKALTKAYAEDQKQMDALFLECGSAQDGDPHFRQELPHLLARVRSD